MLALSNRLTTFISEQAQAMKSNHAAQNVKVLLTTRTIDDLKIRLCTEKDARLAVLVENEGMRREVLIAERLARDFGKERDKVLLVLRERERELLAIKAKTGNGMHISPHMHSNSSSTSSTNSSSGASHDCGASGCGYGGGSSVNVHDSLGLLRVPHSLAHSPSRTSHHSSSHMHSPQRNGTGNANGYVAASASPNRTGTGKGAGTGTGPAQEAKSAGGSSGPRGIVGVSAPEFLLAVGSNRQSMDPIEAAHSRMTAHDAPTSASTSSSSGIGHVRSNSSSSSGISHVRSNSSSGSNMSAKGREALARHQQRMQQRKQALGI